MLALDHPRLRKPAASLFAAFTFASASAQAADADEETLWKTKTFDAVVALKPCAKTGVCGSIYWLNPDDRKLHDYFGDPKTRGVDGPTREDVAALCGFSPKMSFNEASPGHWQGKMDMRGMNMTVNVDATRSEDGKELRVVTSKGIFWQTETWERVMPGDARYPKCQQAPVPGAP
jgi:uncharacterized protein (DUF2147 family)